MATDESMAGVWYGPDGQVSELRGRLFAGLCLGATVLALALVFVFLLFVANDAIQPGSADVGWFATFALTLLLPSLAALVYYYHFDPIAGRVAYTSLGLPLMATLVTGGVWIIFNHLIDIYEWLALFVGLVAAGAVVVGYDRLDRDRAVERFVVQVSALAVGLFVVREAILGLPVLPSKPLIALGTVVAPASLAVGWRVRSARESDRAGGLTVTALVVTGAAGMVAGPALGIGTLSWMLLTVIVGGSVTIYVEHVWRTGVGRAGLAFPVVVVGGALVGWLIVESIGFGGPNAWLDVGFLTAAPSRTPEDAGIYPALVGSILMLLVIVLSAFPVGVGAAIYLEEYAPSSGPVGRIVNLIEINIANLAGVPSVVYGVLGLAVFIRTIGMESGTVIVGGFTVGLLILPIVIISSQEAIRAVPDSIREASYGMGATRWQTVRNVVLPRAMPGIFTGTILALGRAIGETAPLIMILSPAVVRISPNSLFSKFAAMPRQIYSWSAEADPDLRFGVLAAGVLTLLVVLLAMNATAIIMRNRYQRS
ncbi:phosphate ABC transporter permease PstA [Halomontanus rarus]|uniref:phosphate ABC transporter permease PstA n=1 Tax=Halomontanus rarus TaxID=3034020 RepID=UPI0023E7DB8F|nr:phosphate ABC transporter permease PstA [Halovivax sp. TS33]